MYLQNLLYLCFPSLYFSVSFFFFLLKIFIFIFFQIPFQYWKASVYIKHTYTYKYACEILHASKHGPTHTHRHVQCLSKKYLPILPTMLRVFVSLYLFLLFSILFPLKIGTVTKQLLFSCFLIHTPM